MLLTMELKFNDGIIEIPESIHNIVGIEAIRYIFSQKQRHIKVLVNDILISESYGEDAVLMWQIANGEKENKIILTKSEVKRIASEVCVVAIDDMENLKRGNEDIVFARWLCWHYFKKYKPLRWIQVMFKRKKNHASILHSYKVMSEPNMMSLTMINRKTEFYKRINEATINKQNA